MNSILILTRPLVFFPGRGPVVRESVPTIPDVTTSVLESLSESLSESMPAWPLDRFNAGLCITKGPWAPFKAAGLSSTNCMFDMVTLTFSTKADEEQYLVPAAAVSGSFCAVRYEVLLRKPRHCSMKLLRAPSHGKEFPNF